MDFYVNTFIYDLKTLTMISKTLLANTKVIFSLCHRGLKFVRLQRHA